MNKLIIKFSLSLLAVAQVLAEDPDLSIKAVTIVGRPSVLVTKKEVSVGDLAEVVSRSMNEDEAAIAIQKIVVDKSPAPGAEVSLSAAQIVARLKEEGVNLSRVGYSFPRTIQVKRAARLVGKDEIRQAIEKSLRMSNRDVSIRDIDYRENLQIAPGIAKIEASLFNTSTPGKLGFSINIEVDGEKTNTLEVMASIDEWKEVPIAKRAVQKGVVITGDDVMMARLNVGAIPADSALDEKQIIGLETNRDIPFGDVFRKAKLNIPALIVSGAKVTLIYKGQGFEATARGTALEGGAMGQSIRVRNDSSKKVIEGTISDIGLVEVR